jgi:peptidyl-prolyl cis-trans isomerase A (cyclophilin A)
MSEDPVKRDRLRGAVTCGARRVARPRQVKVDHLAKGTIAVTEPATKATLHIRQGSEKFDVEIDLFPNHTPKTVQNFAGLADGQGTLPNGSDFYVDPKTGEKKQGGFYDGLSFHRVIPGFMIQGGDPLGNGTGGPGYDFDDEIHGELSFNEPYVLAMANAGKRGGRGTNGSQFFITVSTPTYLQGKHAIFGRVADDQSRLNVDRIAATPTGRGDVPVEPVVIESVTIHRG